MAADRADLLTHLLEQVSRSFYLTLRILPASVNRQIGLAYLLARTTDTVADTELVPLEQRLDLLRQLRERILGLHTKPLELTELARRQGTPAERVLLERVEESLALLNDFSATDQTHIREVLRVISSGQELDLNRFSKASVKNIVSLRTDAELDDYTYRVAGCVGEFWTRLCRAHLFPEASLEESALLADAVRFGKGLQLVNILRDIPGDLRQGRCYLPAEALARVGLRPEALLSPAAEPSLRPLYHRYLARARDHLEAGWAYTLALPREAGRVRLGCAWPILLGVGTLNALSTQNMLDPAHRIKVGHGAVRGMLWRSVVRYPFRRWWGKLFEEAARPLRQLDT
jgi:farnesyl-diphosphate farnesyltransferase